MAALSESISPAQKLPITIASAPWKALLSENIQQVTQNNPTQLTEFQLATVTPSGEPRVRTINHRSFWGECINRSSTNDAPIYESDCPTFITGAQSNKGRDIYTAGLHHCTSPIASGGGAQVEILYWFRDLGVQWRIRGRCWLIGSGDSGHQGTELTREAIYAYMRAAGTRTGASIDKETMEEAGWCWNKEIECYAATLDAEQRKGFERAGFRVGIILPEAVEMRDQMKNSKNLWALVEEETNEAICRREWVAVRRWP